jgi:ABC-type transport system involved in Fe-S cluster assembly fused permease/ATPase subunit
VLLAGLPVAAAELLGLGMAGWSAVSGTIGLGDLMVFASAVRWSTLLARLYEPTAGRITVDGTDLREYSARSWQRRVAAIFQDFVQYQLSASDNVAVGAIERTRDRATLVDAAT